MKSPTKFFVILALGGLIPLVVVFIFFFYRINAQSERHIKERGENFPKWIQTSESALQRLARDPRLSRSPHRGESLPYIDKFRALHPEFEEIILKDPQTGTVYLAVPDEARGEMAEGTRLAITVPLTNGDQTPPALLVGFINLRQPALPVRAAGKPESTPEKKMAMLLAIFLTFVIISIPITMFLFYRKVKKVMANSCSGNERVSKND